MESNHMFTDAAIKVIEAGLNNHRSWLAYNEASYFLTDRDVFMFRYREEAEEFSANNLSDLDHFQLIPIVIQPENLSQFLQSIISSPQNNIIMNEQNFEYLKDNLKNMGFGDKLNKDLTDSQNNKYNAWLQIDFANKDKNGNNEMRQYHQNYGFDIEKALNKQPIKELDNADDRKLLVSSLKKGNMQQVNFEVDSIRSKMFIEANPKMRTLNVYDSEKKLVVEQSAKKELSGKKEKNKEESKENKKDNKQERNNKRIKNELESEGKIQGKKI